MSFYEYDDRFELGSTTWLKQAKSPWMASRQWYSTMEMLPRHLMDIVESWLTTRQRSTVALAQTADQETLGYLGSGIRDGHPSKSRNAR